MNSKQIENTEKSAEKIQENEVNVCFSWKDIGELKVLLANLPRLLSNKKFWGLTLILSGLGLSEPTFDFVKKLVQQPSPEANYTEYPINFDQVCDYLKSNNVKKSELEGKNIGEVKPMLIENNKLWPVFNWRCEFHIVEEPIEAKEFSLLIGLNLAEEYCEPIYGKKFQSYYKDYEDSDSWYCTHVQ